MVMQISAPMPGISDTLEQAADEYERLAASLSELIAELAEGRSGLRLVRHLDGHIREATQARRLAHVTRSQDVETMSPIQVRMLGTFRMTINGREVPADIPGQAATVLKYVVSQGRRHSPRDAVMELLWPETEPELSARRLRVVVHTLRKHLSQVDAAGDGLIATVGTAYLLNPAVTIWTDVDEFEKRRNNGWRLHRSGYVQQAFQEYEQAEALYRGDYMEDEPYADWPILRREALRDAYVGVLSMLATISLDWRDYRGCIIWAQKLLAQDSCHEEAYRLLIESHLRLGQRARAARWYEMCARTLSTELGLEPSPETRTLLHSMAVL
jgi:DNA-binding SARP family transcriptional activator